jgi:hypothetical protein
VKTRLAVLLVSVAVLATACSTSEPSGDTGGADLRGSSIDNEPYDDTAGSGVEIVDTDCLHDDARCGTVLIPQMPGSPDMVEVGFRVITDSGDGVPVVLLEDGGGPIELDPSDFPGRPLITVGSRGRPPGGPGITCPEWDILTEGSSAETITAATRKCVERLNDAGIDLAGGTREMQANDITVVLDALGIAEYDLIAAGLRADLATLIATGPRSPREVVYVRPLFSGQDLLTADSTQTLATLDAVWNRCAAVESCSTPGTVEEFLDEVESLDNNAIPYAGGDEGVGDHNREIDAGRLVAVMVQQLDTARGAAFLPELYRLLIERDAPALSAYVDLRFLSSSVDTLSVVCGRVDTEAEESPGLPSTLTRRSGSARDFLAAVCPVWGVGEVDTPLMAPPGLIVTSFSAVDPAVAVDFVGPTISEPTVGTPSQDCIVTAAAAWFDGRGVDDTACTTPLAIDGTRALLEFVDGSYVYDDLTVRLRVPSTWTDYGDVGTWYREADPFDSTYLDIYVWGNDDAGLALAEMVSTWDLLAPDYGARSVTGREWLLAIGEDGLADGTLSVAIAVTRIDGVTLGFVLGTRTPELDALIETVLIPSLEAAAIET